MTALASKLLTVDQFLAASESWEGRWELVEGEALRLQADNLEHAEVKLTAVNALADAIRRAQLPCQALPDGMTVRISQRTAFIPDALVRCGPRLPRRTFLILDPVIVVEVVSPSSKARDVGDKVDGYFGVATIQHYLVLIPETADVVHFRRGQGDVVERRLIRAGGLRLDPPGLDLDVAALFPAT